MRHWRIGALALLLVIIHCDIGGAQPASTAALGGSAQLAQLNAEILQHPQDTALNLRYAELAERLGERRLALAAYERILIYDPQNKTALAGIDRIRRGLQPNTTQYLLAFGAAYESNPTYAPSGAAHGEGQFFGDLNVRDERTIGATRWRTLGNVDGMAHGTDTDLDYAYAGASTGPVWELFPGIMVNPALGAGGSYLDDHFFYGEATASATFEAYPNGAYQSVRIRAALRDYDSFFVPEHTGGYVDATGKFTIPLVIPNTAFSFAPWLRWSEIKGPVGESTTLTGLQPGDYTEAGGQLSGFYSLYDWIVLGANFSVSQRYYRDEPVVGGTDQRRDTTYSPGATVVFPHLIAYQNDLRFDYKYIRNDSNDPTKAFVDHLVTVTASRRF